MTTEAKRRKSRQEQKKLISNPTTSESCVSNNLKENLKHLRAILSVDTIIDDINQEEALEFLGAVENNILDEFKNEAELKAEITENLTTVEVIKLLQDLNVDRDQCKELLDIVAEDECDLIYDFVKGKGYVYVKVDGMVNEQKLRDFIEKEIYPRYADQVENIMF